MEEQDNFHFLFLAAFSLAASILKYSSNSSTGLVLYKVLKVLHHLDLGLRMVVLDMLHLEGLLCMVHNLRS